MLEKNLLTDLPEKNNMLRVSTVVSSIRKKYGNENVILIDNGDLFQGDPVSEANFTAHDKNETMPVPAMARCLAEIGYDAFVLGNHEFDFKWNDMKNVYEFLENSGVPVLAANIVYDSSEEGHVAGENTFTPYIIKTISVNGHDHKIGILGLDNTDIALGTNLSDYPNLRFAHLENTSYSIAEEGKRYLPEMKQNGCEFIIVSYHGGLGDTDGELQYGENTENQALRLIQDCEEIDLLINGHDHVDQYSDSFFKTASGKDVLIVNGGSKELTKSIFRFREDASGTLSWEMIDSENLKLMQFEPDKALQEVIRPYAEEAEELVNVPFGTLGGTWDGNPRFYTEQTDTIDLVLASMLDGGTRLLKEKYGEDATGLYETVEGLDHLYADVSITSITARSDYVCSAGTMSLKDIYRVCRFANILYVLPLKGSELKAIIEENIAKQLKMRVLNGKPHIYFTGEIYSALLFGGMDFTCDLSAEEGNRVHITRMHDGKEFREDAVYLAAVPNYQLGNEKNGLRSFTVKDCITDQEYLVQDAITDYVLENSRSAEIVPEEKFNWNWQVLTGNTQETYQGKSYASLAAKPEEENTYVLYNESGGAVITLDAETDKLQSATVAAYGNDLINPLPDNALRLTVHYEGKNSIILSDEKGRYLKAEQLAWTDQKDDPANRWILEETEGGWALLNGEEYNQGVRKGLEVYLGAVRNFYLEEPAGMHCFNFYLEK